MQIRTVKTLFNQSLDVWKGRHTTSPLFPCIGLAKFYRMHNGKQSWASKDADSPFPPFIECYPNTVKSWPYTDGAYGKESTEHILEKQR